MENPFNTIINKFSGNPNRKTVRKREKYAPLGILSCMQRSEIHNHQLKIQINFNSPTTLWHEWSMFVMLRCEDVMLQIYLYFKTRLAVRKVRLLVPPVIFKADLCLVSIFKCNPYLLGTKANLYFS